MSVREILKAQNLTKGNKKPHPKGIPQKQGWWMYLCEVCEGRQWSHQLRDTWCVCRWHNPSFKRPCNAESRESCFMWKIWDDWSGRDSLSSWFVNQARQRVENINNKSTQLHRESAKEVWNGKLQTCLYSTWAWKKVSAVIFKWWAL